jgi:hypothetical protein
MMIENTLEPRAVVGSIPAASIDWALGPDEVLVLAPPLHGFHGHRFGGMMPRQGGIHEPVSLQL